MSLVFKDSTEPEVTKFCELEDNRFFVYTDDFGDNILAFVKDMFLVILDDDAGMPEGIPTIAEVEDAEDLEEFRNVRYFDQIDFVLKEKG